AHRTLACVHVLLLPFPFLASRLPLRPTLFPYTTLFRSLRPGVAPIGLGSVAALGAACASACGALLVRKLSVTETTTSIAFYSNRSEEHTSELQSRENLVCRLLLEKKKQKRAA